MNIPQSNLSRRNFLRNNALAVAGFYIMPHRAFLRSNEKVTIGKLTRDLKVDVLINQLGYVPSSGKFCAVQGKTERKFQVIDILAQSVAYEGTLMPAATDLGEYLVGDFSTLRKEGRFYIKSDDLRSYPFSIAVDVYQPVINMIVHYFSLQRCGASTTGYLSPCHLDDGLRLDNGKHRDVTGGWHDACDLRKWVDATIYGMIGLGKAYELQGAPYRKTILDELYWGNQYFLKMQEPEGYVMNFVGGDVKEHADSNRWTDNVIREGSGTARLIAPDGKSGIQMLVFNSTDDRIIRTDPVGRAGQYNFITAEAMMARITRATDAGYADKCLQAARKCFQWCASSGKNETTGDIGAAMLAALEMYKTTKLDTYRDFAVAQAADLAKLQASGKGAGIGGFFYTSLSDQQPYKNIWQGCQAFMALCDLVQAFPSHGNVSSWKAMITAYAHQYLSLLSARNAFGIVPFGLYAQKDPGGNRKIGDYWYRYFMEPQLDWWVGINSNLASAGVGLLKAASVLKDEKLKSIAQKQLDWIVGFNPFGSSTIITVGHNNPKQFINSGEFYPATPILPGAVMNGLGGDKNDMTDIGDGDWQVSEYWTPMVAYTLWLMAEITGAAK